MKNILLVSFLMLVSLPALSKEACEGKVRDVSISQKGEVVVSLHENFEYVAICNVSEKGDFTMIPEACKGAHKTLLSALLGHKKAVLHFEGTCKGLKSWAVAPSAYFVTIRQ